MVARLASAPWTARLTLAIWVLRLQPEHAADAAPVAAGDLGDPCEPALVARGLLLEDVVQLGLAAEELAPLGGPEAGRRAAVRLHLGHRVILARMSGAACILRRPGGCGTPAGLLLPLRRRRLLRPTRGCRALARGEHGDHVAPVLARRAVHLRQLGDVGRQALQQAPAELGVRHLATTEHDRDLDLVTLLEEPHDVTLLGLVVVRVDLGPHLHFLEAHEVLLAARFLGLDRLLVLELGVVHDLADRRALERRDLDQVQVLLRRDPRGLGDAHDPELLAGGADDPDLRGPDALVDPRLNADAASLLPPVDDRKSKKAAEGPLHHGFGGLCQPYRRGVTARTPNPSSDVLDCTGTCCEQRYCSSRLVAVSRLPGAPDVGVSRRSGAGSCGTVERGFERRNGCRTTGIPGRTGGGRGGGAKRARTRWGSCASSSARCRRATWSRRPRCHC